LDWIGDGKPLAHTPPWLSAFVEDINNKFPVFSLRLNVAKRLQLANQGKHCCTLDRDIFNGLGTFWPSKTQIWVSALHLFPSIRRPPTCPWVLFDPDCKGLPPFTLSCGRGFSQFTLRASRTRAVQSLLKLSPTIT
jgi:hypothetical protein